MRAEFTIDNFKCGGCANTIRKALADLPGITEAKLDEELSEVSFTYADEAAMLDAKKKLASLGYPESGTLEGLDKMAAGAKSYVSCAVGRITNKIKEEAK